jgi:hypothetical protein
MHSWQDLAGIGAPVRVFLLTDLLQPDFPFGEVKLAVFLNAFMLYVKKQENALFIFFSQASFRLNQWVYQDRLGTDTTKAEQKERFSCRSPELRQTIKTKLQCNGRTLAWLYAPGLLDAEACFAKTGSAACTPSVAAASKLVGLPLEMNTTEAAITTTFERTLKQGLAGASYGAQLGLVSPQLACTEGGGAGPVNVLGTLAIFNVFYILNMMLVPSLSWRIWMVVFERRAHHETGLFSRRTL